MSRVASDMQRTALAIVRVTPRGSLKVLDTRRPTTSDWPDNINGICLDLDHNLFTPLIPVNVPRTVSGSGSFTTGFGYQSIATDRQVPTPPVNNSTPAASPQSGARKSGKRQLVISHNSVPPPGRNSTSPGLTVNAVLPPTPAGARGVFFVNNVSYECMHLFFFFLSTAGLHIKEVVSLLAVYDQIDVLILWILSSTAHPYAPVMYDFLPGGSGSINQSEAASVVVSIAP